MKDLAKRIARMIWRLSGPLRRPISRKLSTLMQTSAELAVHEAAHPLLGELLIGVAIARREVGTYRNETNLLLDSLVRELTRLQDEVASLRAEIVACDAPASIPFLAQSEAPQEHAHSA